MNILKTLPVLFALNVPFALVSQSNVSNFDSQELIVKEILGENIEVIDYSINCAENAFGKLESEADLPFNNGLLLTTGSIGNLLGENNTTKTGTTNFNNGNDQLSELTQSKTYDACTVNLKVRSASNKLNLSYFFGGEEYQGSECSDYNDTFGLLVKGGKEYPTFANIAPKILTDGKFLNIENINGGKTDESDVPCKPLNKQYYIDNTGGIEIQYNGYTAALNAEIAVTPCEVYDVQLTIADVNDRLVDSGILIAAESFTADYEPVTIDIDQNQIKETESTTITFSRNQASNKPYTFSIAINGTATNGVDFKYVPEQLTIAANEYYTNLELEPILDKYKERVEFVIIEVLGTSCTNAEPQIVKLLITDKAMRDVDIEEFIADLEYENTEQESTATSYQNFEVYPNPANNFVNIAFKADIQQSVNVQVYNYSGALLINQPFNTNIGENNLSINTSQLPPGLYNFVIKLNNNIESERVLIR